MDLLCSALSAGEREELERGLQHEPAAAREYASLERLRTAARGLCEPLATDPVDPALAQRIALRVRDQVSAEEHAQRRNGHSDGARWSLRARVRILLASLAVHVLVLGWLVLREGPAPEPGSGAPVELAVTGPLLRAPGEPSEVLEPLDLGPIVSAEEIPDSLLVGLGLGGLGAGGLESGALESGGLESGLDGTRPTNVRVAEHPEPVQFEMLARSRAEVRSKRLARVGLEASETLDTLGAVARGLQALAARQREDGSFPLDLTVSVERRPSLGPVGMSALALLPFLAEGRRSAPLPSEVPDPVVARGLGWLQAALRVGPGRGASDGLAADELPADDLALAVVALSEDYMLSYGRLAPAETVARGRELRGLVEQLAALQRPDGSFRGAVQGGGPLWPLLALDAAGHTGLAMGSTEVGERLARWYRSQARTFEGLPADAAGRPDPVLAAAEVLSSRLPAAAARLAGERQETGSLGAAARLLGKAALLGEAASLDASAGSLATALALYRGDAQGFRTWNRRATATLRRRLGPTGAVLRGDPIADTALTLLSLQAAYRLY